MRSRGAVNPDRGAFGVVVGRLDCLVVGESAVINRKLSLGSQSENAERRIARLLSAHTTCRLQRRSLHAYLIDLLSAHARGDPAPLLT